MVPPPPRIVPPNDPRPLKNVPPAATAGAPVTRPLATGAPSPAKPPPSTTATPPPGDVPDQPPVTPHPVGGQAWPRMPPDKLVVARDNPPPGKKPAPEVTVVTGGPAPNKADAKLFLVTPEGQRLKPHGDHFDLAATGNRHEVYMGKAALAGARPDDRTHPADPLRNWDGRLKTSVTGATVHVYDADTAQIRPGPDGMFTTMGNRIVPTAGGPPAVYRVGSDGTVTVANGFRSDGQLRTVTTGPDGTVQPNLSEAPRPRSVPQPQDRAAPEGRGIPGTPDRPIQAVDPEKLRRLGAVPRSEPARRGVRETGAGRPAERPAPRSDGRP